MEFVDDLGRAWRKFLEANIGPFDTNSESPNHDILVGSQVIKDLRRPHRPTN
jgi:hypothetical protein